jgi:pimeloyl-ACP methyl ester carboxylesterase
MEYWSRIAPLLSRHHRVVRVDLTGFGGSEKPRDGRWYSMEREARQVALALRQLRVRRAIVVGHSMGGAVATELAQRRRALVAGAVLVDTEPNHDAFKKHRDLFGGVVAFATFRLSCFPVIGEASRRLTPNFVVRRALRAGFRKGYDVPDFAVRSYRRSTYTAICESGKRSWDYGDRPLDDRLKASRVPVLVIFGKDDRIVDTDRSVRAFRRIPGVRVAVIRGSGHSPIVERPASTARLILHFVRGLGGGDR